MRTFLAILFWVSLISCESVTLDTLKGNIIVNKLNTNQCVLLKNGDLLDTIFLPIYSDKELSYTRWYNKQNKLLVSEKIYQDESITKINLKCYDIEKKTTKMIIEVDDDEQISEAFLSPNDSLLVYNKRQLNNSNKKGNLLSLTIKDVANNTFAYEFKLQFDEVKMFESPWSYNNDKLCLIVKSNPDINQSQKLDGLCIFDLKSGRFEIISLQADKCVWSPDGKNIAYLDNDRLYVYDILKNKVEQIYKEEYYENITYIHWTLDSKNVFLICPKNYFNRKIFYNYNEKLINIFNKHEVSFKKPRLGFNYISWK